MADYWGIDAIAKRMGVASPNTIRAWHRTLGFLMYRRRRPQLKPCWYTNDQLIHAWELARCQQDRIADANRRAALKNQPKP